jgi:hypothetical protein
MISKDKFKDLDRSLREARLCAELPYATLNPQQEAPTSFCSNYIFLQQQRPRDEEFSLALYTSCNTLIAATLTHFPETIFWDFDFLFGFLSTLGTPSEVRTTAATIVQLFAGYGVNSQIRFRYTHDFIYGYDWARWVAKKPEARNATAPYSHEFLGYLVKRQKEIEALIAQNDAKYGTLAAGEVRNPYAFNRSPEQEASLLRKLAKAEGVPVLAWQLFPKCRWDRDYERQRNDIAARW